MRIGIIGAGNIGGNCARRLVRSGRHEVKLSFATDPSRLSAIARELAPRASVGSPAEAVAYGDIVILSVPWDVIPQALHEAGSLSGKIIIDTCNQYGFLELPLAGRTAAEHNAARMPGARYTKSFNTLTAKFQQAAAERARAQKVVQWLCGDDQDAKRCVEGLIEDAGYVPVDLGGIGSCAVMEAPRRSGALYGEEYREADVPAVLAALRAGGPLPPPPRYPCALPSLGRAAVPRGLPASR